MGCMDNSTVAILLSISVSVCSILAFLLGRKKEASQDGKRSGVIETDIRNMSLQVTEMKKSLDVINDKLADSNEKRETEYRHMLVQMTELSSSYKSLHKRVDAIEQKCDIIVRGG